MATGHAGESGLQRHSIGDSYPYSVVIVDNAAAGCGRCEIRNLISGETLGSIGYRGEQAFAQANYAAEFAAVELRRQDRVRESIAAAESPQPAAELWECLVLIPAQPTTRNFANAIYADFRRWLASRYTGWTIGETRRGVWFDESGNEIRDDVSPLYVAVANPAEFRDGLRQWVSAFGQTCLYFRWPSGRVELLYPQPANHGRGNWFGLAE